MFSFKMCHVREEVMYWLSYYCMEFSCMAECTCICLYANAHVIPLIEGWFLIHMVVTNMAYMF
ncbi:hypothetical protein WN944_024788 [Citrus x changshan-huyou]|uniref:Uncharacterized protein n=1 Tax=Citrus x changshan-huyou TaxID=2935761 RepID=A0AAP0LPJ3_9ROSI